MLSVAAVFVFLIGGTILYRNAGKNLTAPIAAQEREAAEQDNGAVAAEDPGILNVNAEEPAVAGTAGAAEETEDAAMPAVNMLMAEAYEEAPSVDAEAMVIDAAEESDSAEAAYESCNETKANKAAEDSALMMSAAEEASETAAPATAAPTEPAAEPEEAPEQEKEAAAEEHGFLREAGAFFTDMGHFLLAALPYLAVLAVPAVAALVVRRRKKRG